MEKKVQLTPRTSSRIQTRPKPRFFLFFFSSFDDNDDDDDHSQDS